MLDERNREIHDLRSKGFGHSQIAEQYGLCKTTIRRICSDDDRSIRSIRKSIMENNPHTTSKEFAERWDVSEGYIRFERVGTVRLENPDSTRYKHSLSMLRVSELLKENGIDNTIVAGVVPHLLVNGKVLLVRCEKRNVKENRVWNIAKIRSQKAYYVAFEFSPNKCHFALASELDDKTEVSLSPDTAMNNIEVFTE